MIRPLAALTALACCLPAQQPDPSLARDLAAMRAELQQLRAAIRELSRTLDDDRVTDRRATDRAATQSRGIGEPRRPRLVTLLGQGDESGRPRVLRLSRGGGAGDEEQVVVEVEVPDLQLDLQDVDLEELHLEGLEDLGELGGKLRRELQQSLKGLRMQRGDDHVLVTPDGEQRVLFLGDGAVQWRPRGDEDAEDAREDETEPADEDDDEGDDAGRRAGTLRLFVQGDDDDRDAQMWTVVPQGAPDRSASAGCGGCRCCCCCGGADQRRVGAAAPRPQTGASCTPSRAIAVPRRPTTPPRTLRVPAAPRVDRVRVETPRPPARRAIRGDVRRELRRDTDRKTLRKVVNI